MRCYKIISESAVILMLALGLAAAPLSSFTHDCSACPAPCCSQEKGGCCGETPQASCAQLPQCDDCALFSFLNAVLSGTGIYDFSRSHLSSGHPVQNFLKSMETFQDQCAVSAYLLSNLLHSPPHRASMVLRI